MKLMSEMGESLFLLPDYLSFTKKLVVEMKENDSMEYLHWILLNKLGCVN